MEFTPEQQDLVVLLEGIKEKGNVFQKMKELTVGVGNNVMIVRPEGMWLGNAVKASANIIMNMDGSASFGSVTIHGRSGQTIADAINASGNFINDVINPRLDTASKYILSDFNFGSVDYAGAVKAGDITWNSSTGALTGGSGIVINRAGIIGAQGGVAKFTIDVSGNATFAGTLSAVNGTFGTITAGNLEGLTITGGTLRTAASGAKWWCNVQDMGYYDGSGYPFFVVFGNGSGLGDAGDVGIGWGGTPSIRWDDSAGTLTIRGILNADDLAAGTITGRTIRTASSGARWEATANEMFYYTGTEYPFWVVFNNSSGLGDAGDFKVGDSSQYMNWDQSTGKLKLAGYLDWYVAGNKKGEIGIDSDDNIKIKSDGNDIELKVPSARSIGMYVNGIREMLCNGDGDWIPRTNESNQIGTTVTSWKRADIKDTYTTTHAYSDKKLKKNIKTIKSSLDTVKKLRGVSFDFKKDNKSSFGVIADELEKILPELVSEDMGSGWKAGMPVTKSYEPIPLIGYLIEAVKELNGKVDELAGINVHN